MNKFHKNIWGFARHHLFWVNSGAGFTLIEILIVATITIVVSTSLISNFSRSRLDLNESANVFIANVRSVQSKTISGEKFNGYYPCGFGIHYRSVTSYSTYAGPNSSSTTCSTQNRNLDGSDTENTPYLNFIDQRVEFKGSFVDIFFEPPDPKTFINNNSVLNQAAEDVVIGKKGGSCPQDCKTICIYPSGRIEVSSSAICP